MKTQNLMLKALCALAAAAAVSMGCTGLEPYSVDAPEDLADKIAEYQAEKQASQSDDYTEITITTAIAGAEDNSTGWWTEFSQYFIVPSGKKLVVEFENFGSGANNWNNWNVCVATPYERGADGYSEYFVLRSDWYGWGNADYDGALIEFDYGGQDVNWDEFREKMQGAYVTLSLDHARAGAAFLEVKNVAKDGFVITEKYIQPVSSTEDIEVFLICDGSHFNIKKAYLVPSEIAEIPDEMAESISVAGLPAAVELGAPAEDILALHPDGVLLSNGPGDPAGVSGVIDCIHKLLGKTPIMGICLGHQLLGLACGAKTGRLRFGHHGCNHPVKNLLTGEVEITSQNHNVAVLPERLPAELEVTHLNLNDGSIEGIRHRSLPAFSVQYHPEAAPGPHDSRYLFAQFRNLMLNQ